MLKLNEWNKKEMQQIVTTSQMRFIDHTTINGNVDIGYKLMKEASEGLAGEIIKSFKGDVRKKVAILCGKGNNGGDGFLAAAILKRNGYNADCFLVHKEEDLEGEALRAYHEYTSDGNVINIKSIEDINSLKKYNLIVDALLGTGLKGAPYGIIADIIKKVNSLDMKVVSADTPSGLNCDTGEVYSPCIRAYKTVTMGFCKIGFFYYPAKDFLGEIVVKNLSYPNGIVRENYLISLIGRDDVSKVIPKRIPNGSKYDHGVTGIIAGSPGMTGAPSLAMNSALRSGCGMVLGIVPQKIIDIISVKVTEPVLKSVPGNKDGCFTVEDYEEILKNIEKTSSLLIGPGLSLSEDTQLLIRKLVKYMEMPIVLDADGLNAFKGHKDLLKNHRSKLIITPHRAEFQRLFGELPEEPEKLIKQCREISNEYDCILVLKGKPTIVIDKLNGFIIDSGDDSLAKAGTGDVLSGIICSFIAQGATLLNSVLAGVYIHGIAGRIAAKKYSNYSVLATDVINSIGLAIKEIVNKNGVLNGTGD